MKHNSNDQDLNNELSVLKERARKINYKNGLPSLPKPKSSQKSFDNLMIGFYKRLYNWKNGLVQMENPGGTLGGKSRAELASEEESDGFDSPYAIKELLK